MLPLHGLFTLDATAPEANGRPHYSTVAGGHLTYDDGCWLLGRFIKIKTDGEVPCGAAVWRLKSGPNHWVGHTLTVVEFFAGGGWSMLPREAGKETRSAAAAEAEAAGTERVRCILTEMTQPAQFYFSPPWPPSASRRWLARRSYADHTPIMRLIIRSSATSPPASAWTRRLDPVGPGGWLRRVLLTRSMLMAAAAST